MLFDCRLASVSLLLYVMEKLILTAGQAPGCKAATLERQEALKYLSAGQ